MLYLIFVMILESYLLDISKILHEANTLVLLLIYVMALSANITNPTFLLVRFYSLH
ncbi:hypothetical protein VCRA2123O444_20350 [Vibrio crassostreae]|nr:hypothetical protein VCRA2118O429_10079 [Vibrio crassostreae]CAK1966639.1 hypothetical protein VCRA2113O416_20079 [Vibrio crassostreae]CAK1972880.1 hypothetical protein VCRA2117O428_20078 [Vibrio crassostreae]CAK1974680.1 hypothetical protein VCRA2119O430_20078 [Vibrio crassostreae]CAK1998908.1 hypothetical protein VCRA2114O422_20350 [Vibrio crassostreae]